MLGNKKKYNKQRVVYVVINPSLFIFIPQCDSEGEDDKVNNLFTNLCFTSLIKKKYREKFLVYKLDILLREIKKNE